ncbi:MAG: arylsulfatase [Verrucomicrobiales bacterium]|nr:arylsulfatase [Verrucomicrobiales bacterium]
MRFTVLIALAVAIGSSLQGAENKQPPNIIYMLLDDAGYGDLSCYGQKKFTTPNIDKLATEGIKFSDHYSGSTVCAPTRCVLMTGMHTGHSFVRGNREIQPEGQAAMPADIQTIPRILKKGGYTTGAFGKWGLGYPGSESDPMEHFDRFYGYNCQRCAHTYYPDHLWNDREKQELDGKTYAHDLITEQTLDFIKENKDKPFFAYLAITIPHAAMHVPDEYSAPFRKKFPQFEDKIGKYAGPPVTNPIAAFAGMMKKVDDDVGDLMSLLKELNIDDNTIVFFTSDNGPHKEGGHDPDFFDSNGPLTGYKRDLTEGGIRTFLISRWPGKITAGTKTDHVSAHWDMLPTFCDLAGIDSPGGIDGISMLPTLTGTGDQKKHDYLYWEFYERGGRKAARWGDWKAIQNQIKTNNPLPIEIYDLSTDIAEENNLADSRPDLVKKAKEIFEDAHTPSPNWTWEPTKKKPAKPSPKKKAA